MVFRKPVDHSTDLIYSHILVRHRVIFHSGLDIGWIFQVQVTRAVEPGRIDSSLKG